jgi:hypothetical protein
VTAFIAQLEDELAARRVRRSVRRRIVLEYADHVACEPESEQRLGDPAQLAGAFAAELAADDVRAVARNTFASLALAAFALVLGQLTIGPAGGYPGNGSAGSTALAVTAIVMILVAPQVALVAGSLGALRAFRRRHSRRLPDAEVALIHRRCAVGGAAGLVTCAALLLYVAVFTQQLSGWWLAVQAITALIAAGALIATGTQARRVRQTIAGVPGSSGGLAEDFPLVGLVLASPRAAVVAATLIAGACGTLLGAVAERSLIEGLERGFFESLVVGAGLALTLSFAPRLAARGARGRARQVPPDDRRRSEAGR